MFKHSILCALTGTILTAAPSFAENVEIYLIDMLDNKQAGYCVDIAGGKGESADPADGLQGHTCYSPGGALGFDQVFDTARFADGQLYMTNFDVCAEVSSTSAGSSVGLAKCDGSAAQSFIFSGNGTITPTAAPDLCLTVGEATRSGRSAVNQIKVMSLETCSADQAAYQTWGVRSSLN